MCAFLAKIHKNKKGFTLAEVLIVVAIMSILAGFGFVAVSNYNKKLTLTEMDDTAKKIFLAAQNHLTIADANGEWKQLVNKKGTSIGDEDCPTLGSSYYVIFGGKDTNSIADDVRKVMLPDQSVNLASDGKYAIIFNRETAAIYGVYYSASSTFGNGQDETDFVGKIKTDIEHLDSDSSLTKLDNRKAQNPLIGYYGNSNNVGTKKEENTDIKLLQKLKVYFINSKELTLVIEDPNADIYRALDPTKQLTRDFYITIKTSENPDYSVNATIEKENFLTLNDTILNFSNQNSSVSDGIVLKDKNNVQTHLSITPTYLAKGSTSPVNEDVYFITFDSLTAADKHFINLFQTMKPGLDVTADVTMTVNQDGKITSLGGSATDNSLFEQIYSGNGGYTARVSNIRHLENLSQEISGVDIVENGQQIKKAILTQNLDLDNDGYSTGTRIYASDGFKNKVLSADENFIGINVPAKSAFTTFEGNKKTISNMRVVGAPFAASGESVGSGLFSSVNGDFSISNLTLEKPVVTGTTGGSAGSVIGAFTGDSLSIKNINIYGDVAVEAEQQAGGVIGYAETENAVELSNVHIAAKESEAVGQHVSINSTGATAGGIVGTIKAKKLVMNDATMKPDTTDMMKAVAVSTNSGYVQVMSNGSSNAHTGGLIGRLDLDGSTETADDKSTIVSSYVLGGHNGFVASIHDGNAGGLIGTIVNGKGLNISDSFSTTYVQAAGAHNAGGFIGEISGGSITMKNCYVGGRTKAASVIGADGTPTTQSCYIHDTTAVTESGISTDHEGRYNVMALGTSGAHAGGFLGMLSNSATLNITDVYTTGSTYAAENSTAGGFVGAINNSTLTAGGCYAAGFTKSYSSDGAKAGAFVGNIQNGGNLRANKVGTIDQEKRNYVVDGLFAKEGSDDIENVHDLGVTDSSIVMLVDNEKENTPFGKNQSNSSLPYDISLSGVLYPWKAVLTTPFKNSDTELEINHCGDWIIPKVKGKSKGNEIVNSNKLYVQFTFENKPGTYKWNIWLHGEQSNQNRFIQMRFTRSEDGNILDQKLYSAKTWQEFKTNLSDYYTDHLNSWPRGMQYLSDNKFTQIKDNQIISRFYIDDVSVKDGNFYSFFTEFYPGEYLQIRAIKDDSSFSRINEYSNYYYVNEEDKYNPENVTENSETTILGEVNSLYDSDPNVNESNINNHEHDLSVAYISNSRHLMNLDRSIYLAGNNSVKDDDKQKWPQFSKALQIADIIWTKDLKDDEYTAGLSLKADPYLQEVGENKNLETIYYQDGQSGVSTYAGSTPYATGDAIPCISIRSSIKNYDGNGHTLENFAIRKANDNAGAGLFTKPVSSDSKNRFIIENLFLRDFYTWSHSNSAAGSVIGKIDSGNYVKLLNVYMTGEHHVRSNLHAAGLVGLNEGDLIISNCSIITDKEAITADQVAGGFVGQSDGDLEIQNSKFSAADADIHCTGGYPVGGLVGNQTISTLKIADSNFSSAKATIYSATTAGVGIFIGQTGGNTQFEQCDISGSNIDVYNTNSQGALGGYIGKAISGSIKLNSCNITGREISIHQEEGSYGNSSQSVGGFVGYNSGTLIINEDTGDNSVISGSDITLSSPWGQSYVAGYVGYNGTNPLSLNHVNITGSNIKIKAKYTNDSASSDSAAGGLVGRSESKVSVRNSTINVPGFYVLSGFDAGGFIGAVNAGGVDISGSSIACNDGNIISDRSSYNDAANGSVGGLIGRTSGDINIQSVKVYGDRLIVYASGVLKAAGGFIGSVKECDSLSIDNSVSSDYVDARTSECAGGFLGYLKVSGQQNKKISKCYSAGRTLGKNYLMGSGATYKSDGTISSPRFDANIIGKNYVGGFIGYLDGTEHDINVEQSFSSCSVTSVYGEKNISNIKGLGGFLGYGKGTGIRFKNCYSVGLVRPNNLSHDKAIGSFIGGLESDLKENTDTGFIRFSTNNTDNNGKYMDSNGNVIQQAGKLTSIGKRPSESKKEYELPWYFISRNNVTHQVDVGYNDTQGIFQPGLSIDYPFNVWTTDNGKLFYYGDWDQAFYEWYMKSDIRPNNAKSNAFSLESIEGSNKNQSLAKIQNSIEDSVNETTEEEIEQTVESEPQGYLTPAGISTETQPDIVTKKQTVRRKAS